MEPNKTEPDSPVIKALTDMAVDIKGQLKKVTDDNKEALTSLKGDLKVVKDETDKIKTMQEQLDGFDAKLQKKSVASDEPKSLGEAIKKALTEKDNAAKLVNIFEGKTKSARIDMKAVTVLTPANVVLPDQRPGIITTPNRKIHIRDLIPMGTTSSNLYRFIQETGYTDGNGYQVEGATKGESDFTLTNQDAPVETIASFLKVSRQMLSDVDGIASYLSIRAPQKLLNFEDAQLLNGAGTTGIIEGLTIAATAQAYTSQLLVSAYSWDKIVFAIASLLNLNYEPDFVLVNPTDYAAMSVLKGTTGMYTYPIDTITLRPNVLGLPIIPHPAVTAGKALVGAFGMGCQIMMREGLNIQFFEQDDTNVQKNLITVRIEERLAFPIFHPDAFYLVNFATS